MLDFIRTLSSCGPVDHSQPVTSRVNAGRTIFLFSPLTEAQSRSPFHVCFWANNVLSQHNRPLILLYNKQAFRSGHMQELLIKMQQTTPPSPRSHARANITTRVHTLSHTNENILYSDLTLPHEHTAYKQWSLEIRSHHHSSLLHWRLLRSSTYLCMFLQTTFDNAASEYLFLLTRFIIPRKMRGAVFHLSFCSPPLQTRRGDQVRNILLNGR